MGLKGITTPFLYGILVKRSELSAAMFTPSRLLLRLGNQMNSKFKGVIPLYISGVPFGYRLVLCLRSEQRF